MNFPTMPLGDMYMRDIPCEVWLLEHRNRAPAIFTTKRTMDEIKIGKGVIISVRSSTCRSRSPLASDMIRARKSPH